MLTHLDTNVLIYAARGREARGARALAYTDDSSLQFAASVFLELELLPNSRGPQLQFYNEYLDSITVWASDDDLITKLARQEALAHGIGAMDALHLAAAAAMGARLVTFEKLSKPLFRSSVTQIISLADA